MSDTPRTDAIANEVNEYSRGEWVPARFARRLERELNAAIHDLQRAMANHVADLNAAPPSPERESPVVGHTPAVAAPYVRAAFINAIAEEGTKAEAVEYLQKEWNENCELRRACKESLDYVRRMEGSLSAPAHPLYQVLKALI